MNTIKKNDFWKDLVNILKKISSWSTDLCKIKNDILKLFREKKVNNFLENKWINPLTFRDDVSILLWLIELKIENKKYENLEEKIKTKISEIINLF